MIHQDTIVAISTPPGRGGIGVVRISGDRAEAIARTLIGKDDPLVPRHAIHAFVRTEPDPADAVGGHPARAAGVVDEVVCTSFPGPHSYTGEDVVEVSGHGNPVLLTSIVREAMRHGARLARPGEFTLRAFLNGRLDLVQAEAVADIVDADTPEQARRALDQLGGTLSGAITEVEQTLFALGARIEASLDFPDEGYHFIEPAEIVSALAEQSHKIGRLTKTARRGRILREGRHIGILGRPNVGKSSIFNALLGADRAIVTAIAGTTRDLLTERCDVLGIPVTLVDTAGLRDSDEAVEREGIARAEGVAQAADAVLVVFDASLGLRQDEAGLLTQTRGRPRIVVVNKCDLVDQAALTPDAWPDGALFVSARTGEGIDTLRRALYEVLVGYEPVTDEVMVTNARHADLLARAGEAVERARAGAAASASEEFVLADVQDALSALQEVTGKRASSAVLEEIFSRFCIGK